MFNPSCKKIIIKYQYDAKNNNIIFKINDTDEYKSHQLDPKKKYLVIVDQSNEIINEQILKLKFDMVDKKIMRTDKTINHDIIIVTHLDNKYIDDLYEMNKDIVKVINTKNQTYYNFIPLKTDTKSKPFTIDYNTTYHCAIYGNGIMRPIYLIKSDNTNDHIELDEKKRKELKK